MFSSNPFSRFWSSSNSSNSSGSSTRPTQSNGARDEAGNEGAGEDVLRLVVKWGKDRFNIPVPRPETTPLSTLINTLSAHTSVPAPQLKLISNGAVLRNPSLPLAAYGLKDGSVIVLVGSKDQPTATVSTDGGAGRGASGGKRGKEVVPTTEPELKTYVEEKKSFLHGLAKDIETYEQGCQTFIAGGDGRDSAPSTTSFTHLQQSHARLSELLLQGLLRLDGIEIPPDLDGARQARKQAIKDVQRELDKVDAKWAEVKASEKKE